MYRSRNRNRGNNIKGPNSALTQFLQEEGISAESIKQRWLDTHPTEDEVGKPSDQDNVKEHEEDKNITVSEESKSLETSVDLLESSDEDEESKNYKNLLDISSKRRLMTLREGDDSDEEEYHASESPSVPPTRSEKDPATILKQRARTKKLLHGRKKRRKRAANLLDQKGEEIPSLQQIALSVISKNISSWETDNNNEKFLFTHLRDVLGGISLDNLNRLANALSKNRALNDNTLQLFLKTDLKSLTFYDCSKVSYEGYKTLAIFSPHLEELSLQMCGQLNNEALLYIAEKLPNLRSLKLDGPFLINEDTWTKFFQIMKGRLQEFHVSNTHRFTDKSLNSMLQNCHTELVSLGFSRLDSLFNYAILPQYLTNEHFHTLVIEYPYNEEDVSDEVIINILGQVGPTLKCLVLKQCDELTDSMIVNGMNAFLCGTNGVNDTLKTLVLESLDQITSDSLVYFFSQISLPSMETCSLMRCTEISDDAIVELFLNCAKDSLIHLNLNSLKNLTAKTFSVFKCDKLETLDLGFIRCIDDGTMELICKQNLNLQLVDVFGDNLITKNANIRQGVKLLGRQSDSI
ncbi:similar to Saccharomyces cerevisiae YJR052W RAD7 Protein that recognizes and binds damaged DNA in an ATP-dependent manner (with Rad16p) during nucleotide excision repair [Maudiozyma saulgeensis]|uniref:Similar to Saccharomyces cerevisiae YJR052W RAD7 Protein that recognizes and binds damaged DNA in an ATP-dependent manner (With Rad16p) during nucleotide excision repair n=1 Tax=Maudiozyma saulgeensis TaxID=1789683 RepID=A0A1X7R1Q5_9SACH|nr:similar to Saccharomyces cerevisiae YJR052W RAD7 Protein that recognizes and binds damaged DNA in an ATP-dependent manner (with Rad16p) during nucleotide excision repair [Kazachstania saulgeensis]